MFRRFQNYSREFPYNLKLAYPVVVGLLGHTFVQLIDNVMVGQLGTAELAAVSLGNSFIFVAMSVGIGFSTAITPLTAEADGANNIATGRSVFVHGLLLCGFLGVFLALSVWLCKPLLFQMGQPAEVVVLAVPYVKWVTLSLIPLVAFQAFKQFSEGLSHTRPAMYATLLSNVLNVFLNYFLIFGYWIFPKMGIGGAAIGTFAARTCMLLFIVFYLGLDKRFTAYVSGLFVEKLQFGFFKKIIRLGFPSALQMLFEVAFFTAAIWMSGILGKNPQAANQIALNLSAMTFMVAMGLGVAAMIRVGNQKGRNNYLELRRVAFSLFLLIFIFDIIFCMFFLLTNDSLPWLYLDGNNPLQLEDVTQVVQLASGLLIVSAFFQISDGLQAVVLGVLRGLQDVIVPAWITFFAYVIFGLPISYYLGTYTNLGVTGIWIGLLSGLTFSAVFLFVRFQYLTQRLIQKLL